ncbi:MAG: hypothetical protein JXA92_06055 [candidate division Zixibacteria bacterium]|nr:hypothetical protein [candidate division Zixibacteria bacterium]
MVKENKFRNFIFILLLSLIAATTYSAEIIVPSGTNVALDYQISAVLLKTSDTLIITRELVNNESFSLTGLYISENLPFPFEIVTQTVELNHAAIDYIYMEALYGMIIHGYSTFYWLIDDPDGSPGINNTIYPEDTLNLVLKITCSREGNYELSEHTASFYSEGNSYFTYGDSPLAIIFEAGCCRGTTGNVDCSEIEEPDISDITRLIDYLYLSHVPLCCVEEADANTSGGDPDISDITRLIDYLYLSHTPLDNCP